MQAAHFPHHLIGGTQMQMVGVAELHLAADVLQILSAERALDGTLGAHIHKHRGLDSAVGAGEFTAAGLSFCLL